MMLIPALLLLAQTAVLPGGVVHGHVVDRDTGRPLARAVVRLLRLDPVSDEFSTTTDERGAFRFDGVPTAGTAASSRRASMPSKR